MNEYEKMSEQSNEMRKNMILGNKQNQPESTSQEFSGGNTYTFTGVMGIIIIILGVIGSLGILLSSDMDYELATTLTNVGTTLIGCLAIGSVLLALDKIIRLLEK